MDLLTGLRSVGFVTGAMSGHLGIMHALVRMLRVGGRGTVGADVAGVGGCWRRLVLNTATPGR